VVPPIEEIQSWLLGCTGSPEISACHTLSAGKIGHSGANACAAEGGVGTSATKKIA
jgi:hypothetical protein